MTDEDHFRSTLGHRLIRSAVLNKAGLATCLFSTGTSSHGPRRRRRVCWLATGNELTLSFQ